VYSIPAFIVRISIEGVSYSIEAVRQLLKKHNLRAVRPKAVPGSPPSPEVQKNFIEKLKNLRTSGEPGTKVLFGDAMHLVRQNIPGRCWGDPLNPPVLETNSARRRLNILGAYESGILIRWFTLQAKITATPTALLNIWTGS
jgi:hypothetical protein